MRNYITGSSGFVGSNLLSKLTGETVCITHDKISSCKLTDFDNFYFCSAYGNMSDQQEDDKIIQANITDLVNVLTQLPNLRFKSFIYISTSSVKLPIQTMYSRTKKCGEELILSFIEKYRLPLCVVRPFSVTGVGEQTKHLIPVLIDAAYTGKEVNLVPEPTHDFIDIDDLTDGILNLSLHGARGIFELGTGKKTSNQEVFELVEKISDKNIKAKIINNMRAYDTQDWVSKNFKSRSWGWLPRKSLELSIKEMCNEYTKSTRKKNN